MSSPGNIKDTGKANPNPNANLSASDTLKAAEARRAAKVEAKVAQAKEAQKLQAEMDKATQNNSNFVEDAQYGEEDAPLSRREAREQAKADKKAQAHKMFKEQIRVSHQSNRALKQMSREHKQLQAQNPNSWTVATSRNTPEPVRKFISQNQTPKDTKQTPKEFQAHRLSQQASSTKPQTQAQAKTLQAAPKGLAQAANQAPLKLLYQKAQGTQAKSQSQAKNPQKDMTRAKIFQTLRQGNPNLSPNPQNWPAVMAQMQGKMILVKDGQKYRAFELKEDGSLEEQMGQDSDGSPLSPEARAQMKKVLRQRQSQEQDLSQKQQAETHETGEKEAGKLAANKEAKKLEGDLETRFALLLHKVLEEKKKSGKALKEGQDPEFPKKGDWLAFFANLKGAGNAEQGLSKSMDKILKLLFRGLFDKKGAGQHLVGDLTFANGNKDFTEKFAQIAVADPELLEFLKNLKPGQFLDLGKLKKAFGEQLKFLSHKHQAENRFVMTEGAEAHVKFDATSRTDPYSQARLEGQLMAQRKKSQSAPLAMNELALSQSTHANGVFANVYELINIKKRFPNMSKNWVLLTYLILGSVMGISLTWMLMELF